MSGPVIPVILFAYARPSHLARVLSCLRGSGVPLILAYADGAKGENDSARVAEVRALLRAVDWCELRLVERAENFGLGRNVLAGVTEVAKGYDAFIVWEDDLVCVPGTYVWMCAALRYYANDLRVMSVSAWTHPRVTPSDVGESPYFDGRADCWVWGAWSRSWRGMTENSALEKMRLAEARGKRRDAYGADLPVQAGFEERRNVWAVRWLYHHFQHGGLCLRPPWSMVEHIGFDVAATNTPTSGGWDNPPLRSVAPIPAVWPGSVEHASCRALWQAANPVVSRWSKERVARVATRLVPSWIRRELRSVIELRASGRVYRGDYGSWALARANATGYDSEAILQKAIHSTRLVRDGLAAWERDTVLFHSPVCHEPLLAALRRVAAGSDGALRVLDFGGALGSTWWQHRCWLEDLPRVRWSVVEQAGFVAAGRAEFSVGALRFYDTAQACFAAEQPNTVLLSSVLPYIERPHDLLAELLEFPVDCIIIDRTGFTDKGRDWLAVQHVPESIYRASYPCWFFDRARLLAPFAKGWTVTAEWPTFDGKGLGFEYRGLMLERLPTSGAGRITP